MTTTVNERPIECDEQSVIDLLHQRKTQLRRIVQPPISEPMGIPPISMEPVLRDGEHIRDDNGHLVWNGTHPAYDGDGTRLVCDDGRAGDLLWVRETYTINAMDEIVYKADYAGFETRGAGWKSGRSLPRSASRILLRLTDDPYPARVATISNNDVGAEGCEDRTEYEHWWNTRHATPRPITQDERIACYVSYPFSGTRPFVRTRYRRKPHFVMENPWVWVLTFAVVRRG